MLRIELDNEVIKWWCGTVIIGAIPILIRLLISLLSNKDIELFNVTELICFGYSIQISSLFFSAGQLSESQKNTVVVNTTLSIVFIVLFSVLYSVTLLFSESFDLNKVKWLVGVICGISLYCGQNLINCAIIANKMA